MQIDNGAPFFRRPIVPWYDSEASCLVLLIMMYGVIWFAAIGLYVALSEEVFFGFICVPIVLVVLSGGVIVTISARMVFRLAYRQRRISD